MAGAKRTSGAERGSCFSCAWKHLRLQSAEENKVPKSGKNCTKSGAGSNDSRSYLMKQFWFKLTVVVVASSAAGWGQVPKSSAAPAPPTQPASSSPVPVPAAMQQQAAVAPAAGGSTGGPLDPNRYVIGAEDSLQISVWKDPTLSGTIPVRPDGMISLNLIGDLKAAGLTPM